jgi:hypothetical protein
MFKSMFCVSNDLTAISVKLVLQLKSCFQLQDKLLFQVEDQTLRAMFAADTHLLGTRQGHWFDKLRREWQMKRSFQTAMTYFRLGFVKYF